MPNNKKHHYVPRFYLKRFSPDAKSINIWNIPNNKKVISANLKNQCYKNYFYGKELKVEEALGNIEGHTAGIFRRIDQHGFPPPQVSGEYLTLVLYVLMQYGRTAYSADALDEMNDKMIKHLFGPKAEQEGIDLSKFSIGIKDAAQYSLGITTQFYPLLLDMDCKLLVNETDVEFITSDNPVVLYNQLFSFRRFGSNTGLASKGLQIIIPISPTQLLLFFDPVSYGVGNRSCSTIMVSSLRDVFELNTLQMCSAHENIYYQDDSLNIDALHRKAVPFRRQRMANMDVFTGKETENRKQEFIATSREDIRTNLNVSFIRVTKSAKKWRDKFRKSKMQPAAVVRNQELCDDHDDFLEMVDNNLYKPGDFFKYICDKNDQIL